MKMAAVSMEESFGSDEVDLLNDSTDEIRVKKKPGIIYLSTLPPYMNVTKVKELFGAYGEVGRVFLQPLETELGKTKNKKKKKPPKHFTEGWIEFKSKRVAKQVSSSLNNTLIGGKKTSKFYDHTWNIKYLPRFKWVHLSERLAYERAAFKHKMRNEIEQAKREANFFKTNLERSKKKKKLKDLSGEVSNKSVQSQYSDSDNKVEDRTGFLKSLFVT